MGNQAKAAGFNPAAAKHMRGGGRVQGKGTPTSDNIPAMLSPGEFVMPADSTAAIGAHNLEAARQATHQPTGKAQGFQPRHLADGGLVDPLAPPYQAPAGIPAVPSVAPVPGTPPAGFNPAAAGRQPSWMGGTGSADVAGRTPSWLQSAAPTAAPAATAATPPVAAPAARVPSFQQSAGAGVSYADGQATQLQPVKLANGGYVGNPDIEALNARIGKAAASIIPPGTNPGVEQLNNQIVDGVKGFVARGMAPAGTNQPIADLNDSIVKGVTNALTPAPAAPPAAPAPEPTGPGRNIPIEQLNARIAQGIGSYLPSLPAMPPAGQNQPIADLNAKIVNGAKSMFTGAMYPQPTPAAPAAPVPAPVKGKQFANPGPPGPTLEQINDNVVQGFKGMFTPSPAQAAPAAQAAPVAAPAAADDGSMSYGQQMGKVGGFFADAAGTALKTIVGAPGYGINRVINGPTPAQAAAQPAAQPAAPVTPNSGANPAAAPVPAAQQNTNPQPQQLAPSAQPPVQSGVPVGAAGNPTAAPEVLPGITKTVANGRTSYSDAAGAAGFNPAAGKISAQNMAAADAMDARGRAEVQGQQAVAQLAKESADAQASIAPALQQARETEARMAAEQAARGFKPSMDGVSARDAAQMANSAAIAQTQANTQLATNAANNTVQREGNAQRATEAAARNAVDQQNANTQAATGKANAAHSGAQTSQVQQTTQAAQQLEASKGRYAQALQSGDAKKIAAAENELRGLQGKWEKDQTDVFDKVQTGIDTATGAPIYQIYSKRTGLAVDGTQAGAKPAAAAPLPPKDKLVANTVYQTGRGPAKWDGKQFIPQ